MGLAAYDIDGTLTEGVVPEPGAIAISGRIFEQYDEFAKELASKMPVYIRGVGPIFDWKMSAAFKVLMINLLGVTDFYENDPRQIEIIRDCCSSVSIHEVGNPHHHSVI